MPTTTMTVSLDDSLMQVLRETADAAGMTPEAMMIRYLEALAAVRRQPIDPKTLPPVTRRTRGILPPTSDEERRSIMDEHRMRKYGQ